MRTWGAVIYDGHGREICPGAWWRRAWRKLRHRPPMTVTWDSSGTFTLGGGE